MVEIRIVIIKAKIIKITIIRALIIIIDIKIIIKIIIVVIEIGGVITFEKIKIDIKISDLKEILI